MPNPSQREDPLAGLMIGYGSLVERCTLLTRDVKTIMNGNKFSPNPAPHAFEGDAWHGHGSRVLDCVLRRAGRCQAIARSAQYLGFSAAHCCVVEHYASRDRRQAASSPLATRHSGRLAARPPSTVLSVGSILIASFESEQGAGQSHRGISRRRLTDIVPGRFRHSISFHAHRAHTLDHARQKSRCGRKLK